MFFIRRKRIVRRRVIHPDKAKITFSHGQSVSVMGMPFTIAVSEELGAKYSSASAKGGLVKIKLSAELQPSQKDKHVSNLARRAITRTILPDLTQRVKQFNDIHFQSELGAVRLKDNVSNWGSCSRRNNINLDFRLLFGPQEILDAVIVHELAHTKHRNHSREFYNTLLAVMPDNRKRLRWLRDNGSKLNSQSSGIVYEVPGPQIQPNQPAVPIPQEDELL